MYFFCFFRESIGHRCIPSVAEYINLNYKSILNSSDLIKVSVIQLYDHLDSIALLSVAALIITVVLVFLLRYIAKIMIFFIISLSSLGSIGNVYFSSFSFKC
jgi:hypothetical protein